MARLQGATKRLKIHAPHIRENYIIQHNSYNVHLIRWHWNPQSSGKHLQDSLAGFQNRFQLFLITSQIISFTRNARSKASPREMKNRGRVVQRSPHQPAQWRARWRGLELRKAWSKTNPRKNYAVILVNVTGGLEGWIRERDAGVSTGLQRVPHLLTLWKCDGLETDALSIDQFSRTRKTQDFLKLHSEDPPNYYVTIIWSCWAVRAALKDDLASHRQNISLLSRFILAKPQHESQFIVHLRHCAVWKNLVFTSLSFICKLWEIWLRHRFVGER